MTKPGTVFLVGAGPGDPGLLTQRAVELMQYCDVVCYDLLVGAAILSQIPADKELLPVGYRGYCGTSIEYGMHPEVVEQALAGKTVLRLKAGDPFIFGRATEECRCLTYHGIDYQVVPGISASLGAAAYAGFPLTSNGMASDVTFASGHQTSKTLSNWAALGQSSGTLVIYMGAKKLNTHAQLLMSKGKSSDTPVAVISAATGANQRMLSSTLGEVGDQIDLFDNGDPMLVIIGEVVSLSPELNWRNDLPLRGYQVLACTQEQSLLQQIKLAGAVVVESFIKHQQLLNDADWQRVLAADALHLVGADSVCTLIRSCIANKLDMRKWHWHLSGDQAATESLAKAGVIAAERLEQALVLSNGVGANEIDAASGRYQLPDYELPDAKLAILDDIKALECLLATELCPDLILSRCPELVKTAQNRGYSARVLLATDTPLAIRACLMDLAA
ncbi:uroporphyrinogen-III C-methyltransferase [Ferrimonas lipolytica]|uniref:uroporphyrinogen-III C-methyltransferase n=1 Tax=Ferrimonas lipolytica TaxID=2724191 RepID=A0A6H1UDM5_9GAMM|nr:uroporphyrinogen-III C-methyltransferase [Ferrimonas lipolytica]QIZ76316.1 uroporphyrinogen-III C-methyltransferase [Ferrimonas lipolytica]